MKILLTALVAATAMTAVAADARQNARQRGMASGAETRERAATRDLNAQQLAGGGAAMAGGNAAMAPAAVPEAGQPMAAPEAGGGAMAPMTETTPPADGSAMPDAPPATPQPDAAPR